MSRIGKEPITIPEKVTVTVENRNVKVKGPKGELEYQHRPEVELKLENGVINVAPFTITKQSKSLWGLTRTLVSNMVVGVTDGFQRDLEFTGVGYKAAVKGKELELHLGYSHAINYPLPEGITAKVEKNKISIFGCSKELVGFTAAKIRTFRPPEPYKGKGIRYSDEVIIRKAGKTGAAK